MPIVYRRRRICLYMAVGFVRQQVIMKAPSWFDSHDNEAIEAFKYGKSSCGSRIRNKSFRTSMVC